MIVCRRENHGFCGELTAFSAPIFDLSVFTLFALKLCSLPSLWCWVETCDWLNYQRHQISHNKQQHVCAQLYPTLCDPMGCSPPGSSVHGISQASILEWVAISFSRRSSRSKDWSRISCISCLAGGFFTTSATWEARDWPGHRERGQGSTMPCLGLKRLCVLFPSSNPAISPWGHKESGTIEWRNWAEPCHLHVDKPSSGAGGWDITWRRIHPIQDYTGPAYSQLIPRHMGDSSQHQQSCLPNPPLTTEYIPGQKNCPANPETCVQ